MANNEQLVTYLKRVTADLQQARSRVTELEDAAGTPVAVVGMGCRFPGGADSPDRLWQLVDEGTDAVSAFPADRGWQTAHLGDDVRLEGGFLHEAAEFDPAFFGISPREALAMDPQQRLLLETTWEALENAGIDPATLRGSAAGVFVGVANQHYGPADAEALQSVQGHVLTGGTTSVASGRLAYTLGLEGPAVTVDTACSSALVALHLAVRSLRAGESTFAFAGGAAVMADPGLFTEFAQQGGLAGDGRCKSFAADADGTGWGEGVGVLALCRLDDARRLGYRVLATIAGSAVNSDGASNGLTAPNGPAQQRVIRAALADARLSPAQIDAVEAHGTGTRLGDPVEAQALIATYGEAKTAVEPLWLGSVKSNVGHTQAAAGMAGVIKMVLAMRHGLLPKTLHADAPTGEVDWTGGTVRLLTEARPWPETGRPRRAAVSAFGISGTNAHVVLEQGDSVVFAETALAPESAPAARVPLVLSARGEDALRAQARRLSALLDRDPDTRPADLAFSLATTRARLTDRAVLLAADTGELRRGLDRLAAGLPDPLVGRGRAGTTGGLAFLFTGQGAQRAGMGAGLYAHIPVFAAAFDEICAQFDGELDEPLRQAVFDLSRPELLDDTGFTQPALFAVEVAMFRLLEHWGVRPDVLLGHSIGELAAAHVAGVLSLADAARLVAARGRLMRALPAGGAMVAVEAAEDVVAGLPAAEGVGERVSIAAVNGPASVVLSGDEDAVLRLAELCSARGLRTRRLRVSHAFHSARMEPMLEDFRRIAEQLDFRPPRIPIVSNVTGLPLSAAEVCSPDYWVRHVRGTVRFHDGMRQLVRAGVTACLEVGPGGVLTAMARDCLTEHTANTANTANTGTAVATEATLVRDQPEQTSVVSAVAQLHLRGFDVDWPAVLAPFGGARVQLPTYPFQRQRFWLTAHQPLSTGVSRDDTGNLRYRETWAPITRSGEAGLTGTWLLVRPTGANPLADELTRLVPGLLTLEADGTDGLADRLKTVAVPLTGVLSLLAAVGEPLAVTTALRGALEDAGITAPLWCVTSSAVVATADDPAPDLGQAQLSGVGRGPAGTPGSWGGVLDLPSVPDRRSAALLVSVLADPRGEDEIAVRPAGLFARRLVRADEPGTRGTPLSLGRAGGTVLVTGDFAGLTTDLLTWLTADGPRRIMLAHRPGDVPQGDAWESVEWPIGEPRPPALGEVNAVLHLESLTTTEIGGPAGRTELAELAAEFDGLDAFLVFSTVAGVWGGSADPVHALAHARLAALVLRRRAAGLPGCCVGWGPFTGNGDAPGATGLLPMTPSRALGEVHAGDGPMLVIADVDWPVFHPRFTALRARPLVSALDEVRTLPAARPSSASAQAAHPFADLAPRELDQRLLDLVRSAAALVLGHPGTDAVHPEQRFRELGFDSLLTVRFRDALAASTGLPVPATVGYDYPTPRAVAGYLREVLRGDDGPGAAAATVVHTGDPIAIVAMACRYPGGVTGPDQLWDLVSTGRDGIAGFPEDRGWDLPALRRIEDVETGRGLALRGGFLAGATEFDAAFFGVSPREATAMDPQQRVLLEVCWESLEHAGIDAHGLRGSRTGVFVGVAGTDYGGVLDRAQGFEGHMMTGTASSVVSGRVSYTFGFEGPAITVDTACSSSLVALHLAAQALRGGECDLALAGGVTVMSTPGGFLEFAKQGGLAGDGRCKSFAEAADGTGWSEGAGILVLQRLSDARRDGNTVLATIDGSALNSDGASNGLTAPNGPAQQRVILDALRGAGLDPSEVDAVEAHGTGTVLGDPIEAQALLATYGRDRPTDRPLWLGSLKSNIGHSMAAAGVGGVIKMVQAMRHRQLPGTLHVDRPTGKVDWAGGAVRLLTESRPWPETGHKRRAGISSFGMSGTNAHVVIAEAEPTPVVEPGTAAVDVVVPWVLSAKSPEALSARAAQLAAKVADGDLADVTSTVIGRALLDTRAQLEHRAVVVGRDRGHLLDLLTRLAADPEPAGVVRGTVTAPARGTVWVFPGQGGQWAGMADALIESSPVFAARWRECERALAPYLDRSLTELVAATGGNLEGGRVDVVQPALFAMMVSLAEVWKSFGVHPAAVVGHSQGEIAAACVAGALSLDDAAKVVALRAKALSALAGAGGMISLAVPAAEVDDLIGDRAGRVSVAAVNGPSAVVVSGEPGALEEILAEAEIRGIRGRRIDVDYASHSAQVERIRDELAEVLAEIRPSAADVPFFSTVTGEWLDTTTAGAEYWYRNLREQVRFHDAVESLLAEGFRDFVEVGPHPVLGMSITEAADRAEVETTVVGTLRRQEGGLERVLTSVAELAVSGEAVDWSPVLPPVDGPRPSLPIYPFQHKRFWPEAAAAAASADPEDARFWEQVGRRDAVAVAGTLGLADPAALAEVLPALSSWRKDRHEQALFESWRYAETWQPLSVTSSKPGRWLVVVPARLSEDPMVTVALRAVPEHLVVLVDGADLAPDGRCAQPALTARLREALAGGTFTGVLSLTALDATPHAGHHAVPVGLALTVAVLQSVVELGLDLPLWCCTDGAVAATGDDAPRRPDQAATWALGRVAALEHPKSWGGLVDLPRDLDEVSIALLAGALRRDDGEDQLAIRAGGLFGRRLSHGGGGRITGGGWTPSGTVLVTGGTGALGLRVARRLAADGARRLVLISRRGADAPGVDTLVADLAQDGVDVTVAACDTADRDAVSAVLTRVQENTDPITAVVHAAGAGVLGPLTESSLGDLATVLAAKVAGIENVEAVLDPAQLAAVVYFSSITAVWGAGDHGVYAAANAVLDARAARRTADGVPTLSIAWGPWAGGGMVADEIYGTLRRRGLPVLDPDLAVSGLMRLLAEGSGPAILAEVDWPRFVPVFTSGRASHLLDDLPEARPEEESAGKTPSQGGSALRHLEGQDQRQRVRALRELVREHTAVVLGHADAAAIEPRRAFSEVGLDSLTAVELRNRLAKATGVRLPTTVVFDHPNPVALADFLDRLAFGGRTAEPARVVTSVPVDAPADDPIAIVAMSCRFPGGIDTPELLWAAVRDEADLITPFPADRGWPLETLFDADPDRPGTSYVDHAGFLHDAGLFDPEFFGISPREAVAMDPQQRLLLEISWEALERAGIDPKTLRGSRTGVYVGTTDQAYGGRLTTAGSGLEGYLATGGSASIASGRISYSLGFEGPAVSVDTACSASLVALHLAAQSLRTGECDLALAGGVMVMCDPTSFVAFSRQRGLAEDGRCKSFAEAADGFSLSEGAGLLLVERLSDARRNGHPVLGLVRGSAVNQDGASNGLTAPNGPSQERVILRALADAGLAPSEVDVVEAHGTGTKLGDPIEAQALLATYGQDRADGEPLWLGSVKSNIGHTQAAAGAAGIIKMVMAMSHGALPKTLHVDAPSSQVDWETGAVELLTESRPWPETGRPRRAGISSFGISGTNAHVVIEQSPDQSPAEPGHGVVPGPLPLVVSARSEEALAAQAARLVALLERDDDVRIADLAWSLLTSRTVHDHSAVLVAQDRGELLSGLTRLATAPEAADVDRERVADGELAMVFTGQGAQRPGMGRELHGAFPIFAQALDEACAELDRHLDRPLLPVMFADAGTPEAELLNLTAYTQPALFALEVALYRLFEHWGVRPDAVLGHSVGELVAAHVAGVWTLADAARVVVARGRLMQDLPAGGAMVAVAAAEALVREHLAGGPADIAAVNGPEAVVVSGPEDAVLALAETLREHGVRTRRLPVSHAFHSSLMDPMLAEFRAVVAGVDAGEATLAVISDVTGEPAEPEQLADPDYWVSQVRREVRFADGVRTLTGRGTTTFLEVGPGAELTAAVAATVGEPDAARIGAVPSLRRGVGEARSLFGALGRVHARGVDVNWSAVFERAGARRIDVPTYAFQNRRFWLQRTTGAADLAAAGVRGTGHGLFTTSVELPGDGGLLFHGRVEPAGVPATAGVLLEAALWASAEVSAGRLTAFRVHEPVPADGVRSLQLRVTGPDEHARRTLTVHHRLENAASAWECAVSATLDPAEATAPFSLAQWPPPGAVEEPGHWVSGEDLYAELVLDEAQDGASALLHPGLLDALADLAPIADRRRGGAGRRVAAWNGVTLLATGAAAVRVHLTPGGDDGLVVRLADPAGEPVAVVEHLVLGEVAPAPRTDRAGGASILRLDWTPAEAAPLPTGSWGVLGGRAGRAETLVAAVSLAAGEKAGAWSDLVALGQALESGGSAPDLLVVPVEPPGRPLIEAAHQGAEELLDLVRAVLADERLNGSRIVLVTRGATSENADVSPAAAAGWGLLLSAQAEHPDRLVLVDLADWEADADSLVPAVAVSLAAEEPQVAVRSGNVLVPRLAAVTESAEPADWASGTVLVTGATGAIGEVITRHLANSAGVRRLLLLSRRGPDAPSAARLVAELAGTGVLVDVVACDAADREALAEVLGGIPAEHPLTGVVHIAGVVDDGTLAALTPDRLHEVLRPKLDAAVNLHELTAELDLSRFVLFSSAVGTLGAAGQANYAAGNAFLDALARQRRAAGLPATSLAWGLWGTTSGMTGALGEVDLRRMGRAGVVPLTAEAGCALFDRACAREDAVLLPMHLDPAVLRGNARSGSLPAALRGLVPAPLRRAGGGGAAAVATLAERLAGLPADERTRTLLGLVREQVCAVLALGSPEALDERRQFRDFGFDSLTAVELRNALSAATGVRLSAAVVFDYPTPAELTAHLDGALRGRESGGPLPMLAQLDRLEASLGGLAADDRLRPKVASRLKALVAACDAVLATGTAESGPELESATDEEIFAFIRTEFGRD